MSAVVELTEAQWTTKVVETARWRGWLAYHALPAMQGGGYRTAMQGDRGFPDLVLARAGVVIVAELKTDRGKFGPGQREWGAAIGDAAVYRLWRPRDWEAVLAELSTAPGTRLPVVVPAPWLSTSRVDRRAVGRVAPAGATRAARRVAARQAGRVRVADVDGYGRVVDPGR